MDFTVPVDQRVKMKEIEKIDKMLRPCLRTKKRLVEAVGDGDIFLK